MGRALCALLNPDNADSVDGAPEAAVGAALGTRCAATPACCGVADGACLLLLGWLAVAVATAICEYSPSYLS